ncbi:hypothetical protein ACOSQ2_003533 [Xanthoceras sorbifolium]
MSLLTTNSKVTCQWFPATLGEIQRKSLKGLPTCSIISWSQCQELFLNQYQMLKKQFVPSCHLKIIFQKADERLKDYIARFQREVSCIKSPTDESVFTVITVDLRKDDDL